MAASLKPYQVLSSTAQELKTALEARILTPVPRRKTFEGAEQWFPAKTSELCEMLVAEAAYGLLPKEQVIYEPRGDNCFPDYALAGEYFEVKSTHAGSYTVAKSGIALTQMDSGAFAYFQAIWVSFEVTSSEEFMEINRIDFRRLWDVVGYADQSTGKAVHAFKLKGSDPGGKGQASYKPVGQDKDAVGNPLGAFLGIYLDIQKPTGVDPDYYVAVLGSRVQTHLLAHDLVTAEDAVEAILRLEDYLFYHASEQELYAPLLAYLEELREELA